LKRVDPAATDASEPIPQTPGGPIPLLLTRAAQKQSSSDEEPVYSCQATEILRAAPTCLPMKRVSQFIDDVRTGNATIPWTFRTVLVGLFNRLQDRSKRILPKKMLFRGGLKWGFLKGAAVGRTPTLRTGLRPGELVKIRSKDEILATVNSSLRNRGLGFDPEMSRFCGRTARVSRIVERCLDEKTGQMRVMKEPCVVLEGIFCEGAFSLNCPRAYVPFWREIWLERIDELEDRRK
jgi:hypothetical protein